MPLEPFRWPTGQRVHAGKAGKLYPPPGLVGGGGKIYVARACPAGVDSSLWGALKIAVDTLDLAINISSLCTGKHATNSRHYSGLAADISKVGHARGTWRQASLFNPLAVELAELFLQHGWQVGEGNPTKAGVLLGPPDTRLNSSSVDHSDHIHLSLARWRPGHAPPGALEVEEEGEHC